jgi:dTDP-4-amino-4,6-dideoxygalactose transaminase
VVDGTEPAWHLYVIRHERVDGLAAALSKAGIGNKVYYRTPAHQQPSMGEWAAGAVLPGTDEAARTHLAIPISPVMTREQAAEVVAGVRAALA